MTTKQTKSRFNWKPDLPDFRDHLYAEKFSAVQLLPTVDLRNKMPPVFDQGELGSCTANALAGQLSFVHPTVPHFSRLFIYRGERDIEGTVNQDAGAALRDGIKFLAASGACQESLWPYNIAKFKTKPTAACFKAALPFKITSYTRLVTLNDMLQCLSSGFPFVFGFTVYESFESEQVAKTGVVSMPGKTERSIGGHAVEAVGYDLQAKTFLVRNSWSDQWGQGGYFTMPFDYVTNRNLSDDFWTVRA